MKSKKERQKNDHEVYVIDWLRMPDEVNAILDIKKKAD